MQIIFNICSIPLIYRAKFGLYNTSGKVHKILMAYLLLELFTFERLDRKFGASRSSLLRPLITVFPTTTCQIVMGIKLVSL